MNTFRVLGTNHTSFTVSSLDRTIAFFRDCLGFDLVSRAPRSPDLVSRITYTKAPAPELAAKVRAQQEAGRVDIDLSAAMYDTDFGYVSTLA